MSTEARAESQPVMTRGTKTRGEVYEGIAFTFCKTATIVVLTQRFALPIAAGAAAIFFVLAYWQGKKETRCIGRYPLPIATFWGAVSLISFYSILARGLIR